MIPLFLTILSSTSIALILKYNDSKSGNPLYLLLGNYFVAAVVSTGFFLYKTANTFSGEIIVFGAGLAFFFVFSFFAFTKAVAAAGTALATVSSRLSVIIPVFFSILIYKEIPATQHIFGFILALFTLVFFYFSLKNVENKNLKMIDYFYVLALLLGIGINDFSLKIFQTSQLHMHKDLFILSIFAFSFIYTLSYILFTKIMIDKPALLRGTVLGIPNVASTFFLLSAIKVLPAIVVYPVVNIGIILFTALLARIIWKEKLNTFAKIALIFGSVSILLLNI